MNNQVSERIRTEKRFQTGELDLKMINLSRIPKDLLEMPWLKRLDLGYNEVKKIENLDNLINLTYLSLYRNRITVIENLDSLTNLADLSLSTNQISEIKNLDQLVNLRLLHLSSTNITEIKNLNHLVNLENLHLNNSKISKLTELPQILHLPKLNQLRLYGIKENDLNIPIELFGTDRYENCLFILQGYFDAIKKGASYLKEVPVIFVGNSSAGKTTLCKFLQKKVFPSPDDHSTHGIEPTIWKPELQLVESITNNENGLKDVLFYIWDFGGQEYFHSTHRLFFCKQAIYVLLWEQKTNIQGVEILKIKTKKSDGSLKEIELPVELFPYNYWLENIRFFADEFSTAPIILVQNKLDEPGNDQVKYLGDAERKEYGIISSIQLSIKNAWKTQPNGKAFRDFERFIESLFAAAKKYLSITARQTNWDRIKLLIKQRRIENIWSTQEFLSALKQYDVETTENSMLSYGISLHHMSSIFFFHDDELLKNYIFINPEWVAESIYQLLDQTTLENGGVFDKEHVLNKISEKYADPFLALIKKFELIFENDEDNVFIAPQYLPKECKERKALLIYKAALPDNGNTASLILHFTDFMPPSIIQRLISSFGNRAIGNIYWKYGVLFLLENQHVLIESNIQEKKLYIKVRDHTRSVLWNVFNEVRRIVGYSQQFWISLDNGGKYAFVKDIIAQFELGNITSNIKTLDGHNSLIIDFLWLFDNKSPQPMPLQKEIVKIFISYAHVDDAIRKVFEEKYLKAIQNYYDENLIVWSDIKLKAATDWDSKIKKEIEEADVIIFFLSNGFLASNYIKQVEIEKALERYKLKQQIIVPIYIEEISKKLLPFSDKQYLPGGKPLKDWKPQNKGWVKIQDGFLTIIDDIKNGSTHEYFE